MLHEHTKELYTMGALFPGSPVGVQAPSSFFDPLTGSLMTEPVKLVNTNDVFDRTSLQTWYRKAAKDVEPKCPLTGETLKGWIILQADDELRRRIVAWADKHKCNLELISRITPLVRQHSLPAPTVQPAEGAKPVPKWQVFWWVPNRPQLHRSFLEHLPRRAYSWLLPGRSASRHKLSVPFKGLRWFHGDVRRGCRKVWSARADAHHIQLEGWQTLGRQVNPLSSEGKGVVALSCTLDIASFC